jgi:signal transduction histidine kinase
MYSAEASSSNASFAARIHPVSLRFSRMELEAKFVESWRNAARRTNRMWSICALVAYVLMAAVLYRIDPAYTLDHQWFRLYVCIPILLVEFGLACLPGANKRLFDAMYLIASFTCFGNAAISHGAAPGHLQFFFLLELSLIFVFCGNYFRASFTRVAVFIGAAVAVATPIVLLVHIGDQTDVARLTTEMFIITALAVTVLLVAYHRELLSRRNFRGIYLAGLQEAEASRLAQLALADSQTRSHFLSTVGAEFQLAIDDVTRRSNIPESGDSRLDGYLEDIHTSSLRLQKTVKQIMDAAHTTDSHSAPQFTEVHMDKEIGAAVERNRFLFVDGKSPVFAPTDKGLPPVCADLNNVRDILDELISNAAKYGSSDEAVQCQSIQVSAWTQQLRISNGGPLRSNEELDRVFVPFVQLDDGLNRGAEGLGLGLSLAQRLAEQNGGRLYLEPREKGGVTAILELPAAGR